MYSCMGIRDRERRNKERKKEMRWGDTQVHMNVRLLQIGTAIDMSAAHEHTRAHTHTRHTHTHTHTILARNRLPASSSLIMLLYNNRQD
jgi:hypothetical protein